MAEIADKPGIFTAASLNEIATIVSFFRGFPGGRGRPRDWALDLAAVDTDPRESLITWIKESA